MLVNSLHTVPFASASRRAVRPLPWRRRAVLGLALLLAASTGRSVYAGNYRENVLFNKPVFYWTFDDADPSSVPQNLGSKAISATYEDVTLGANGLADIPGNKA